MRVAILQPNYIPWRGYFDFFKQCNLFIVYDDVQYTKNDWRNRNLIKTRNGHLWLTVPVKKAGRITNNLLVRDAEIAGDRWIRKHLKSIEANYKDATFFDEIYGLIERCLLKRHRKLIALNMELIHAILDYLDIKCEIKYSSWLWVSPHIESKTARLVDILEKVGATEYLTGPSAKRYLDESRFGDIKVAWHDYRLKEYSQLWGEFLPNMSIVDTLMNCGRRTKDVI